MLSNNIRLGTKALKNVYVGTAEVKAIYIGKSFSYSELLKVEIQLATGIKEVQYTVTEKDGNTFTGTISESPGTLQAHYGSTINFSATAYPGYTAAELKPMYLIGNTSVTINASLNTKYKVTLNNIYNNKCYKRISTMNATVGHFSYSVVVGNSEDSGVCYDQSVLELPRGAILTLYFPSAVAGFTFNKFVGSNGTSFNSTETCKYTIPASDSTINADFIATTSTRSCIIKKIDGPATSNLLSKTAFTVTPTVQINIPADVASGTELVRIPNGYFPPNTIKFAQDSLRWPTADHNIFACPIFTITPKAAYGSVIASIDSYGSVTVSGGGKWGGGSATIHSTLLLNSEWSTETETIPI